MDTCCNNNKPKRDWLLRISISILTLFCGVYIIEPTAWSSTPIIENFSKNSLDLLNTMKYGLLIGIAFLGILSKIPKEFVMSILGQNKGFSGIIRATLAGVLLDLCSHGILMVGTKLYERGASTGQIFAFLIASPWNSFSMTLILISLIGFPWTITFILLSILIAVSTGYIVEIIESKGKIPKNPNSVIIDNNFKFWSEAKKRFSETTFSAKFFKEMAQSGVHESKMVLRWVFLGVILASAIRSLLNIGQFQTFFGPTLLGLGMTLLIATIMEVCSEGTTPIAADILTRALAPGNSFAFLMTGVSTDYTEIMILKETTKSWKIAFLLPLTTVPQVILISFILNLF